MILALGPTFMWAEKELNAPYEVLGESIMREDEIHSEVMAYDYFAVEASKGDTQSEKALPSSTPTPTTTPVPTATAKPVQQVAAQDRVAPTRQPVQYTAPAEIDGMINKYAAEYGADPNMMKKIAKCESNYNPGAISPSGAYHGLYQFVASTWISNRNAMGLDPDPALRHNAEEAIRTAAFKMGRDGYGAWPVCSKI